MSASDAGGTACGAWDSRECTGTPHCPPRCPRFVDASGAPWLVRPPEEGDRGALVGMYRDFDPDRRSLGLPPAQAENVEAWLDRLFERGRNVVAARNGAVRGHAVFVPGDADEPEFAVFVHRDAAGRGLGTELCRHAVAAAADAGADALALDVARDNDRALGVYRRLGFERVGGESGVDAGDAVAMRLDLSGPEADAARAAPGVR